MEKQFVSGLFSFPTNKDVCQPLSVQSVEVKVQILYAACQVQIVQKFVNDGESTSGTLYCFPLEVNTALTRFEASTSTRTIKGCLKAELEENYKKDVDSSTKVIWQQYISPDVFQIPMGHLDSEEEVTVHLEYVTEGKIDDNLLKFAIPQSVVPLYVSRNPVIEFEEEFQTRKTRRQPEGKLMLRIPSAPLAIHVEILMQGKIHTAQSPTHPNISTYAHKSERENHTRKSVQFTGETTDLNRPFVLLISREDPGTPGLYIEKSGNSTAIMAHLLPNFQGIPGNSEDQKTEFIFMVDRSGSMRSKKMDLVKKTLRFLLLSLPPDCYFNIVGFGNTCKFLFSRSVPFDDVVFQAAVAYVNEMKGDFGNTDITDPFQAVYASVEIPGYFRQLFVITDGRVRHAGETLLELVRTHAHKSRVFALGVGDMVSNQLVQELARAGGGAYTFITYGEGSIEHKLLGLLKRALQPSLTNVKLQWKSMALSRLASPRLRPKLMTDLIKDVAGHVHRGMAEPAETLQGFLGRMKDHFGNQQKFLFPIPVRSQVLVLLAIFDNAPNNLHESKVSLSGDISGESWCWEYEPKAENDVGEAAILHKLASSKIVRDIEFVLEEYSLVAPDENDVLYVPKD